MNIRRIIATILAVYAALWAVPGTARAQLQGGDLFATNNLGGTFQSGGSSIFQYTPPGILSTPPFASNLATPRGLAFDSSGNLFVAINSSADGIDCFGDNTVTVGSILKITPGGLMSTFATGFPSGWFLQGLATNSAGNVFVSTSQPYDPCDPFIGQELPALIYKVTPSGAVSSFATIPASGWGLALDNAGNLYVATGDGIDGEILEFNPDGMQITPPFVGPGAFPYPGPGPLGLAFDASVPQCLFVSAVTGDGTTGEIRKFDSNGAEITPRFATGLTNSPRGLAYSAGDLFVGEPGIGGTANPGDILEFTAGGTGTIPGIVPAPGFGVAYFDQGTVTGDFGTRGNRGPEWLAFTTAAVTPVNTAVTLTFPAGTSTGTTTVTPIVSPSATPSPSEFQLGNPPLAFDVTTTATGYTSPIIIAFQVPQSFLDQCGCDVSTLRVLHGTALEDVTCPVPNPGPTPDTTTRTVYASVSTLSPFVIAKLRHRAQPQQPINADGSSVFSVRRGVVPVKFTLTNDGVTTCALPAATIALTRTSGGTTGAIDESVYSGSADTGSNFRISSCQYMYNLSASALGLGTYRADIKINGTVVGNAIFQLK
jgi:hypothetical protein